MTIQKDGGNMIASLDRNDIKELREEDEALLLEEWQGETNEDIILSPNWKTK